MPAMTDKQQDYLDCIKAHMVARIAPPTILELAAHFGVQKYTVQGHVQSLRRKGLLRADTHKIVPVGAQITFSDVF